MTVHLRLGEPAAVAELGQRPHRQPAAAIHAKRAFLDRIAVDHPPILMRRDGDAAAQMRHNQPQRLVPAALLARKAPRHRLDVQRMADGASAPPAASRWAARTPATRPPSPGPQYRRSPRSPAQSVAPAARPGWRRAVPAAPPAVPPPLPHPPDTCRRAAAAAARPGPQRRQNAPPRIRPRPAPAQSAHRDTPAGPPSACPRKRSISSSPWRIVCSHSAPSCV